MGRRKLGVKNFVIFGVDMSSSVNFDNKSKDILVLGEGPTQGLGDITVTPKTKYPINFTSSDRAFALSLHYNGSKKFLFDHAVKMYQFKAKYSEIKPYPLCLDNISKDFTNNNMKKTGFKGYLHVFSIDYNITETNHITDIHEYLMKIT